MPSSDAFRAGVRAGIVAQIHSDEAEDDARMNQLLEALSAELKRPMPATWTQVTQPPRRPARAEQLAGCLF